MVNSINTGGRYMHGFVKAGRFPRDSSAGTDRPETRLQGLKGVAGLLAAACKTKYMVSPCLIYLHAISLIALGGCMLQTRRPASKR